MPETPVIVGASLAVHFFSPRPATEGRAEEGLGHRGGAKRRVGAPYRRVVGNSDPMREAGAPSTWRILQDTVRGVVPGAPGIDVFASSTRLRNAEGAQTEAALPSKRR